MTWALSLTLGVAAAVFVVVYVIAETNSLYRETVEQQE